MSELNFLEFEISLAFFLSLANIIYTGKDIWRVGCLLLNYLIFLSFILDFIYRAR